MEGGWKLLEEGRLQCKWVTREVSSETVSNQDLREVSKQIVRMLRGRVFPLRDQPGPWSMWKDVG